MNGQGQDHLTFYGSDTPIIRSSTERGDETKGFNVVCNYVFIIIHYRFSSHANMEYKAVFLLKVNVKDPVNGCEIVLMNILTCGSAYPVAGHLISKLSL